MTVGTALAEAAAIEAVRVCLVKLLEEEGEGAKTRLAQKLGVSRARVSRMLAPNSNVTVNTLERIAKALGRRLVIEFPKKEESRFPRKWRKATTQEGGGEL